MGFMQAALGSASLIPALTTEPAMRAIPPIIATADGQPSRGQFVLMVSSHFTFFFLFMYSLLLLFIEVLSV